jgi:hypothetical protein
MLPIESAVRVSRRFSEKSKYPAASWNGKARQVFRTNQHTRRRHDAKESESRAANVNLLSRTPGSALAELLANCFAQTIGTCFVNSEPGAVPAPFVSIRPPGSWRPCASWPVWRGAKVRSSREPFVNTLKDIQAGFSIQSWWSPGPGDLK